MKMRAFLCLALLLAVPLVRAQSQEPVVEEVLITGEQPGPALWSATRDGKTLWILGTHSPLPAKMAWRSREVEARIAESQVLVRWVQLETDFEVGLFAKLAAMPALMSIGDNPKGVTLKDRVTPEAYAQWQQLKAKYIGRDNSVEKLRPAFAASELLSRAIHAVGLSSVQRSDALWQAMRLIAKSRKLQILEPEVRISLPVDKPREVIARFREMPLGDAECFARSLTLLESNLDAMKTSANAWATGDLEVLRKIPPPDPGTDCMQLLWSLIASGSLLQENPSVGDLPERARLGLERGLGEMREVWLRTVEDALRGHSTVFAAVPIGALFDAQGPLQALRERGYVVVEP